MPDPIAVVIPVRSLESAKSRLGEVLDAEERRDLVTGLLRRTIAAARDAGLDPVLVVSDDREVAALASAAGASTIGQHRPGLNAALDDARDASAGDGVVGLVVLPADLPLVDADAVRALAGELRDGRDATVVLVPDRHGRGTNALALRPPGIIPFSFGPDSRTAHRRSAERAGARYVELDGPLSVDLDTPEDLLLVEDRLVPGATGGDHGR